MSGKLVMNVIKPARKRFSDFLQMVLNLKDKSSTDTRKDSPGQKVISHAGKQDDPAKIMKQSIKEENNDKK